MGVSFERTGQSLFFFPSSSSLDSAKLSNDNALERQLSASSNFGLPGFGLNNSAVRLQSTSFLVRKSTTILSLFSI